MRASGADDLAMRKHTSILDRFSKQVACGMLVALVVGCSTLSPGDLQHGGLPNWSAPTLGGIQLWSDVAWSEGWRVQRHAWSRHHRLLDEENVRRAWGTEGYCTSLLPDTQAEHLVVLLHGLGRTRSSLATLHERLEEDGYRVASISYASTCATIDQSARGLEQVLNEMSEVRRVSFVTHSLGGRVVLRLLERQGAWMQQIEVGRVVQLAPPNQGSRLAAQLEGVPFVAWVLGPAILEVAEPCSNFEPTDVEFGVITGFSGKQFGWNPLLSEDDDGVVGVSETQLGFPHHSQLVMSLHTFLMNDPEVHEAVSAFLARGEF